MSVHGDRHHRIGGLLHNARNAVPLAAHHKGTGALEVRLIMSGTAGLGGEHPDACLLKIQHGLVDIGHLGNSHVLHRAGRGLRYKGCQSHRAATGDDNAMRSAPLGTANERTEVIGVSNAVRDDDKGCFPALGGDSQNIFHGAVILLCDHGNDSLMRYEIRKAVKLRLIHLDNGDSLLDGLRHQRNDGSLAVTAAHQQLVHRTA